MTVWFYVKTNDDPKVVGETVCASNIYEDPHPKGRYSWILEKGPGKEEYWQIKAKYEELGKLTNVALVYRTGDTVVLGEANDDFVPNFLDPLLEKYGFDNLKWAAVNTKR